MACADKSICAAWTETVNQQKRPSQPKHKGHSNGDLRPEVGSGGGCGCKALPVPLSRLWGAPRLKGGGSGFGKSPCEPLCSGKISKAVQSKHFYRRSTWEKSSSPLEP
ncbi:hypothetical protein AOLI_G00090300 [Acnodon oligacanthus]